MADNNLRPYLPTGGATVDAEALTTITESDVRASRHFQQAEEAG